MEIIVLMKQVPATESFMEIDRDGISIKTDTLNLVVNPYDEIAIEEALRIREAQGGRVTVLSLGGGECEDVLRTALAMGADNAVLLEDQQAAEAPSLAISKVLAAAIEKIGYDLVITGQRAVDDDNYFMGPAVAEHLGLPCITFVTRQTLLDGEIECQRSVDGGIEQVKAALPAVLTTQRGLNEPRYTSLPGLMKAKKKKIEKLTLEEINVDISGEPVSQRTALTFPKQSRECRILTGSSSEEQADALVSALKDADLV